MKVVIASLGLLIFASGAQAQQPNIIVIMSDDQSPNTVSAYGSNQLTSIAPTPNIDRIASDGVRFTNSFVTDSLCVPSRATLWTGKYSNKHGATFNASVFDGSQQTMPKLLDAAGYQTAVLGKWMVGGIPTGFDYFDIINPPTAQGAYVNPSMAVCAACGDAGSASTRTGYFTTLVTTYATDWLAAHKSDAGPFALFIAHKGPHGPWVPSPSAPDHRSLYATDFEHPTTYADTLSGRSPSTQSNGNPLFPVLFDAWNSAPYQALGKATLAGGSDAEKKEAIYQAYVKDYLRTLRSVDDSVGVILDYLAANSDENGLLEANTVVVFIADNGMLVGEHGLYNKREPYEEVLRVPFLMRGPGIAAGNSSTNFVTNVDWAPTILDLAGVAIPSDMDGRSVMELLDGSPPTDWRASYYFHSHEAAGGNPVVPNNGVRTSRYKLIYHDGQESGGVPDWELIDLEADPGELTNVYDDEQYADIVQQLKAEMLRWQVSLGIPPSVTSCAGDVNLDGVITSLDVSYARRCFGLPAEGACTLADFDGNGFVNLNDLIRIARATGQSCVL